MNTFRMRVGMFVFFALLAAFATLSSCESSSATRGTLIRISAALADASIAPPMRR